MRQGKRTTSENCINRTKTLSGGKLGFFCRYEYALTHDSGRERIPYAFKGVDLAVYLVFRHLCFGSLKVKIRPIVPNRAGNMGGMPKKSLMQDPVDWTPRDIDIDDDHEDFYKDDEKDETGHDFVKAYLERLPNKSNKSKNHWDADYNANFEKNCTIVGTKSHSPKS